MQWVDRIGSRLKLRDLHILLTVVHRGSMAKAAAELAISQPAVSKAIADMEHTFGLRLLDRGRGGVEPTAYGRALVTRGQAIFDELKLGIEELAFLADPTVGRDYWSPRRKRTSASCTSPAPRASQPGFCPPCWNDFHSNSQEFASTSRKP